MESVRAFRCSSIRVGLVTKSSKPLRGRALMASSKGAVYKLAISKEVSLSQLGRGSSLLLPE